MCLHATNDVQCEFDWKVCDSSTFPCKGQRSTKDKTNNNKKHTLDAMPGVCTDKPSAPEGPLEVSDIWAEQVKLSWKPPKDNGGGEITGNSASTRKQTLTEVEVLDANSNTSHVKCLVSGCVSG